MPSVGWVTQFTWNVCIFSLFHEALTSLDYISRIVECSMILLWGVKSRSSVQTDAERGSHWAGWVLPWLGEPEWLSYSSGKLQVWWGNMVLPDPHIIVPSFGEDIPVVQAVWKRTTHTLKHSSSVRADSPLYVPIKTCERENLCLGIHFNWKSVWFDSVIAGNNLETCLSFFWSSSYSWLLDLFPHFVWCRLAALHLLPVFYYCCHLQGGSGEKT